VVCELLHAIHRHDRTGALMKKLEVMPREINTLYTQMLSSLAADDQERAYKMLVLTAHNPFRTPLKSIFYAWIDDLDDVEFPPTDGEKPAAWPTMEELIQNVRLQLMSLTKGLLETSNLDIDNDVAGPVVQFSHRTVRDFILSRFDSKLETSRWPTLTQTETYHRLLLAGVTLLSEQHRVWYWNSLLIIEETFLEELPVTLVSGFNRIFGDAYDSEGETREHKHCRGWVKSYNGAVFRHKLSFLHLAAYAGQQEYVMQEIAAGRSLYNDLGQLHVLLSAAAGCCKTLVTALIQIEHRH
jgi:hypothetical protein